MRDRDIALGGAGNGSPFNVVEFVTLGNFTHDDVVRDYCAGLRVDQAWLVVFDQRSTATGERLDAEEVVTAGGRRVLVVRA